VIIAAIVMMRLGFWQLDRLAGRRAFNEQVLSQIDEPILPLTDDMILADLDAFEFRTMQIEGEYDLENSLVLGNQVWADQIGVHILTPLKIADSEAVILVDRGWIPFEDWENRNLSKFDEGRDVRIEGMLRVSQTKLGLRNCLDENAGEPPFQVWCLALNDISFYLPYELLSVYLTQAPIGEQTNLPYRSIPQIEISEGPHLSYAVQWFTFAAILLFGYPFFVNREVKARERKALLESRDESNTLEGGYHGWAEHLEEEQKEAYGVNDNTQR
jgi:surfeit locus 1 family protein